MPIRQKSNKTKKIIIISIILVLLILMIISFGTTQHLTEVVLHPVTQ